MELLELMKRRRSIRRSQERQIPREALEQVLDAGSWAPNAGGGQRTMLDRPVLRAAGLLRGRISCRKAPESRPYFYRGVRKTKWMHKLV